MDKIEVDFLTEEDLLDKNSSCYEIFEKKGRAAEVTDYILTRSGILTKTYWTKTLETFNFKQEFFRIHYNEEVRANCVKCVGDRGQIYHNNACTSIVAIRPVLNLSTDLFDDIEKNINYDIDGIPYVEYLEYPQNAASKDLQGILEAEYATKRLKTTARRYTNVKKINDSNIDQNLESNEVYEFKGKSYIRVKIDTNSFLSSSDKIVMSNLVSYKNGDYVWIEVSPVKWYVDIKSKRLISEKSLFRGIALCDRDYKNRGFKSTPMYNFLNGQWLQELTQKETLNEIKEKYDDALESFKKTIASSDISESELEILRDALYDLQGYSSSSKRK